MNNKSSLAPLSDEQIECYYRDGYLVVPGLVPEDEIDRALAAFPGLPGNGKSWTPSILDHDNPDANPELHRLLVEPHVIGAVEQIFEAPARVHFGMLAVVPANGGKGLEW